jgi:hypothetical protein
MLLDSKMKPTMISVPDFICHLKWHVVFLIQQDRVVSRAGGQIALMRWIKKPKQRTSKAELRRV